MTASDAPSVAAVLDLYPLFRLGRLSCRVSPSGWRREHLGPVEMRFDGQRIRMRLRSASVRPDGLLELVPQDPECPTVERVMEVLAPFVVKDSRGLLVPKTAGSIRLALMREPAAMIP